MLVTTTSRKTLIVQAKADEQLVGGSERSLPFYLKECIVGGFDRVYDINSIYLSNIFDKLDDNPFVLEIANRTIDILNITGLNREISFKEVSQKIKVNKSGEVYLVEYNLTNKKEN